MFKLNQTITALKLFLKLQVEQWKCIVNTHFVTPVMNDKIILYSMNSLSMYLSS